MRSVVEGRIVTTEGPVSAMGRLDCKTPSLIALAGLARDADLFVTISEAEAQVAVERLAGEGLATTASGAAGLAAAFCPAARPAAGCARSRDPQRGPGAGLRPDRAARVPEVNCTSALTRALLTLEFARRPIRAALCFAMPLLRIPSRRNITVNSPLVQNYARAPLAFEQGEGSWLVTRDGERYLDFGSGIAVNALGHAHPHLVEKLGEQAAKPVARLQRLPEPGGRKAGGAADGEQLRRQGAVLQFRGRGQ